MVQPGEYRPTARVILVDDQNRVFLMLTHFDPEVGLPPRWLTPGGGIDAGETEVQAAVRELYEETGLVVYEDALGSPIWRTSGRWDWSDGNHHTFTDTFFELRLSADLVKSEFDSTNWTKDEWRDILQVRWWNARELAGSGEFVGPPGLVEFLVERYS